MKNIDTIKDLNTLLENKNSIEVGISEEVAKVIALDSEINDIYNLMIDKIKKDLEDLQDKYYSLKISKTYFATSVKLDAEVDISNPKVCIRFDSYTRGAYIGCDSENATISLYNTISNWFSNESLVSVYKQWNKVKAEIEEGIAKEYIKEKSIKLEKIQNEYLEKQSYLKELKSLIC
jgi:hypothetical protein